MGFAHIVDIFLLLLTTTLFLAMTAAILIPWRHQDRLSWALVSLKLSLALLFGIATLQALHVVMAPLPDPMRWVLRILIICAELFVFVELIRARKGT